MQEAQTACHWIDKGFAGEDWSNDRKTRANQTVKKAPAMVNLTVRCDGKRSSTILEQ